MDDEALEEQEPCSSGRTCQQRRSDAGVSRAHSLNTDEWDAGGSCAAAHPKRGAIESGNRRKNAPSARLRSWMPSSAQTSVTDEFLSRQSLNFANPLLVGKKEYLKNGEFLRQTTRLHRNGTSRKKEAAPSSCLRVCHYIRLAISRPRTNGPKIEVSNDASQPANERNESGISFADERRRASGGIEPVGKLYI